MSEQTVAAFIVGSEQLVKESYQDVRGMFLGEGCDGRVVETSSFEDYSFEMMNPDIIGKKIVTLPSEKFKKKERDFLIENYKYIPEECLLIVKGTKIDDKIIKPIGSIGKPTFRMFKFSDPQNDREAISFVIQRGKDNGLDIDRYAAEILVDMVGFDLGTLTNEIIKLKAIPGGKIDHLVVMNFCVSNSLAQVYRFYNFLSTGDSGLAIKEARELVHLRDYDFVEQAITKVVCNCSRYMETGYSTDVRIDENSFNYNWWNGNKKNGNAKPTQFMRKISENICHRHGKNGVKYLLSKVCVKFSNSRRGEVVPGLMEEKILLICGDNGKINYDVSRNRSVSVGDGNVSS